MKYTYYPEFDEMECLLWHVYETATEQVISSFLFEEDASFEARRLERGGGFDGYTPSFMLRKSPLSTNEAFEREFYE
jgi:hypothetical protein